MASVRKLPSGNYQGTANWRDQTGKRHRKSFTAETRRQALRLAEDYEAREHTGQTIGKAIDAYVASRAPVLSPSTIRAYTSMASKLKTQYRGFCGLTEPSQKQAQDFINEMLADGSSPKAIRNRIGLISAAIRFSGGTFPKVVMPKVSLRTDFIPSEETMQRITEAASGTKLEIPVALGMMGLRRSEICGLRKADLVGNTLHIHSALVMGADKKHYLKGTKTSGSDRYIRIPEALADQMRGWECDLTPMAVTHAFRKMAARIGVTCRFHDLRHFFVSYCHNVLKLSDAQIQKLGGWKTSFVLRRHYLHSMRDEETADLVAAAFSNLVRPNVRPNITK